MSIHQALTDIGLSDKEVEIYLSALKLGSQPASVIAKEGVINRTTAYVILKSLLDKGLMSKYMRGDVWYYSATQPENLLIYVERKKKELDFAKKQLENVVPDLKTAMQFAHEGASVKLFEGLDGMKAIYDETLRVQEPISEYLFDYNCDLQKMWDFWDVYIARRNALKIPIRLIVSESSVGINLKRRDSGEFRETRVVPRDRFPLGNNLIMIFGDYYAYCSYADGKFYGALIKDRYLSAMELSIFDFIWENATSHKDDIAKKLQTGKKSKSKKK